MLNVAAAVTLMGAAAGCGSDDDGSTESTAASTVETEASTDGTAPVSAVSVVADPGGDLDDLGPLQAQVVTDSLAAAEEQGIDIDEDCYIEAVALLSDEDAQAVIDAGPDGAATLSERGEEIRDAARLCILFPDDASTDSTSGS